jgi:hypothetical protein
MSAPGSRYLCLPCLALALGLLISLGCTRGVDPSAQENPPASADLTPAAPTPTAPNGGTDQTRPAAATLAGQGGDAWPLFRGDSQATGVATGSLPDRLQFLWSFSVDAGGFASTAAIADGLVYVGCLDGKLYAIDLATGKQRWQFATELGFSASAALRNACVYIGDSDGVFYCLDAKSGKSKWNFPTAAEINSSANFYKDNVLFGSQDGALYCLRADSGKEVWRYECENMIQCSPTVLADRGFVAGCDGQLHVIDLVAGKTLGTVNIEAPTLCTPAVSASTVFGSSGAIRPPTTRASSALLPR